MAKYSKTIGMRLSLKKPRERRILEWLNERLSQSNDNGNFTAPTDTQGNPIGVRELIVHGLNVYLDQTEGIDTPTANDNDEILFTMRREFSTMRRQMNAMKESLQSQIRQQIKNGTVVVEGLDANDDESVDDASAKWADTILSMFED